MFVAFPDFNFKMSRKMLLCWGGGFESVGFVWKKNALNESQLSRETCADGIGRQRNLRSQLGASVPWLIPRFDCLSLGAVFGECSSVTGAIVIHSENPEDSYIDQMALGRLFVFEENRLHACTAEALIRFITEVNVPPFVSFQPMWFL